MSKTVKDMVTEIVFNLTPAERKELIDALTGTIPSTVGDVRRAICDLPDDAQVIVWVERLEEGINATHVTSSGPNGLMDHEQSNALHISVK